jgi:hypothetical protein
VAQFRLKGHELELLPFYAQYMNLYLAFLREGALLVQGWPAQSALGQIPGSHRFKQIRTILSDPIGKSDHTRTDPDNADGPLQHVTIWTEDNPSKDWRFIDGVQFTGGPTSGPAVTSPFWPGWTLLLPTALCGISAGKRGRSIAAPRAHSRTVSITRMKSWAA